MIIKRLTETIAKFEKLAAKATPGPWSGEVRETDCILYPTAERGQEDFTIILENQFPDRICRHNVRLILAMRNMVETFCSDARTLLKCISWHDLSANPDDLPIFDDYIEVLVDGYPTTAMLREIEDGNAVRVIWVSYFTHDEIFPTHWRSLPPVGRTVGGNPSKGGRGKPKKQEVYEAER